MGKEINRIRINRLSSEDNLFDEIVFKDGINLILGEKYDETTRIGNKTNGVGKSMSIEVLDYCLLSDYSKSRISRIPKNVINIDSYFILDLTIGKTNLQIRRNIGQHEKVIIIRDNNATEYKVNDAKLYLTELIYGQLGGRKVPSYRELLSILMRDERSEYSDILQAHDLSKKIPNDLMAHLFLLGISLDSYCKIIDTIKRIESNSNLLKAAKVELTAGGAKKLPDVKAEMNALEAEVKLLEESVDAYKTNEAFEVLEKDLVEIEKTIDRLRIRQKVLKRELANIIDMPKPMQVDDRELELVYNHYKKQLGDAIVKSLEEVLGFKNKVDQFQKVLINEKAKELEEQIADVSEQLRVLDGMYAEKMRIIDSKGVLKDLKNSLKIYEEKKENSLRTKTTYEKYVEYDKQKKQLNLEKSQQLLEMDNELEAIKDSLDSFVMTILDIHEAIMGNRESSFDIKTKETGKTPIEISMRIFDDGSHSVDRTKVFIYDMALLFNKYTRVRHPLLLIHDNIFDVDQDTLVQCLNHVYKQEEFYPDFQYILTLNRDKIENEERKNLIRFDVDAHVVARFTKERKFFKRDYQEL